MLKVFFIRLSVVHGRSCTIDFTTQIETGINVPWDRSGVVPSNQTTMLKSRSSGEQERDRHVLCFVAEIFTTHRYVLAFSY